MIIYFKKTLYAIFVHNIYPDWLSKDLTEYKTTMDEPFAYFALICDALQQWNRPHALLPAAFVTRPNIDASEYYNIEISQNHITVEEQDSSRSIKNISKAIDTMAKYIADADAYISLKRT